MTMGRPKLKIARSERLDFRLTPEEMKKFENLCEMLNLNKTQTFLRALDLLAQNPKPKRFKNISGNSQKNSDGVETDGIIRKIVTPIKP